MTIEETINKYKGKIDYLDMEILIAHSLGKTREFVLIHSNQTITSKQAALIKKCIARRITGEPVAYILKHKEFFGLDFIVNNDTLVPRPETELMVELAVDKISNLKLNTESCCVADIGTGSGCIIISVAKTVEAKGIKTTKINFIGTDISRGALSIAKKNSKLHGLDKKIKFLQGDLLAPITSIKKTTAKNLIITANLPYLSKEIYNSAPIDVKKFEPRSALYSPEHGLRHYRKLLEQIKEISIVNSGFSITVFLEISPEQKKPLPKMIKSIIPSAEIEFKKDLAGKWRVCHMQL